MARVGLHGFEFLSTLSLRRATAAGRGLREPSPISIHALLAESDPASWDTLNGCTRFLSTLSLRRATRSTPARGPRWPNFYPRSPCGERLISCYLDNIEITISIHALLAESDWPGLLARPFFLISIHALLAESDSSKIISSSIKVYFYPRSPCGERLSERVPLAELTSISIHALLAESDPAEPKQPKHQ